MRRTIRVLARLYPRAWRRRYGVEFEQFLEDVRPRWRDVPNLAIGAFVMHLRYSIPSAPLKAAAHFALAGALVAALSLTLIPRRYRSSETLGYQAPAVSSEAASYRVAEAARRILAGPELAAIIDSHKVYGDAPARTVEELLTDMRGRIRISSVLEPTPPGAGPGFTLSFDHPDPRIAQAVARELGNRFLAAPDLRLAVLDEASLPHRPISPRPSAIMVFGAGVGALAGLAAGLLASRRRLRL